MVETISSLDEYLGAVGEAFRSADASMAQSLGQNMYTKAPESREERRERYIQGGKDSKERHNRRKMVEIAESQYKDFHNYLNSPEFNSGEFFYYKFRMI